MFYISSLLTLKFLMLSVNPKVHKSVFSIYLNIINIMIEKCNPYFIRF